MRVSPSLASALIYAFIGAAVALSCRETLRAPVTAAQPEPAASPEPPHPHPPVVVTPEYGSVLVIYRTADGEERTITCGGEVSHEPRQLEKLDRSGP